MTVLVLERYQPDVVRAEEFERAAAGLLTSMRDAPGALWADIAKTVDASPTYVLVSEWRTPADADAWGGGQAAADFAQAVDVLLGAEVTRRRFVSPG